MELLRSIPQITGPVFTPTSIDFQIHGRNASILFPCTTSQEDLANVSGLWLVEDGPTAWANDLNQILIDRDNCTFTQFVTLLKKSVEKCVKEEVQSSDTEDTSPALDEDDEDDIVGDFVDRFGSWARILGLESELFRRFRCHRDLINKLSIKKLANDISEIVTLGAIHYKLKVDLTELGLSNDVIHVIHYTDIDGVEVVHGSKSSLSNDFALNTYIPSAFKHVCRQCATSSSTQVSPKHVYRALLAFLKSYKSHCVICHKALKMSSVQLQTCDSDLCLFALEEHGLGHSVAQDIRENPDVFELHLFLSTAAANSTRASTILEPFPSFLLTRRHLRKRCGIFDEASLPTYQAKEADHKDIIKYRDLLNNLPELDLLKASPTDRQLRELVGPETYKLLNHILTSCHSHIVKVTDEKCMLPGLASENTAQYAIIQHDCGVEAEFLQRRDRHGSLFAFHGSKIDNWYSILRNGLRVASNSFLMLNAAAYGNGIYVSPQLLTSLGYSNTSYKSTYGNFKDREMRCVALCEVINSDIKKSGDIWVAQRKEDVVVRYIILVDTNVTPNLYCNGAFADSIRKSLQSLMPLNASTAAAQHINKKQKVK